MRGDGEGRAERRLRRARRHGGGDDVRGGRVGRAILVVVVARPPARAALEGGRALGVRGGGGRGDARGVVGQGAERGRAARADVDADAREPERSAGDGPGAHARFPEGSVLPARRGRGRREGQAPRLHHHARAGRARGLVPEGRHADVRRVDARDARRRRRARRARVCFAARSPPRWTSSRPRRRSTRPGSEPRYERRRRRRARAHRTGGGGQARGPGGGDRGVHQAQARRRVIAPPPQELGRRRAAHVVRRGEGARPRVAGHDCVRGRVRRDRRLEAAQARGDQAHTPPPASAGKTPARWSARGGAAVPEPKLQPRDVLLGAHLDGSDAVFTAMERCGESLAQWLRGAPGGDVANLPPAERVAAAEALPPPSPTCTQRA